MTLLLWAGCRLAPPSRTDARARPADVAKAPASLPAPRKPSYTGHGMAAGLAYVETVFGAAPDARLPLVLSLHGMGDRPRRPFDEFAPAARFISLRAPDPYGEGFSWFPYSVAEESVSADTMARVILRAARMVEAALFELVERRATRGKPLVTGVSQGGMLSFALALRNPDRLRLAVALAGTLPETLWPRHPPRQRSSTPIVALHGAADTVVPLAPTVRLIDHLRRAGYPATLQRFEKAGHDLSLAMHQDRYRAVAGALLRTSRVRAIHP